MVAVADETEGAWLNLEKKQRLKFAAKMDSLSDFLFVLFTFLSVQRFNVIRPETVRHNLN